VSIGYYDNDASRYRTLMRQYAGHFGIHGFLFYYQWMGKHAVVDPTLQLMLKNQQSFPREEPNVPFFLCWASDPQQQQQRYNRNNRSSVNQDDGMSREEQQQNVVVAHFLHMLSYFQHPKYIRLANRPVLAIQQREGKQFEIMNLDHLVQQWQSLAKQYGLDDGIHFVQVDTNGRRFTNLESSGKRWSFLFRLT
jgi:hypothetical protein